MDEDIERLRRQFEAQDQVAEDAQERESLRVARELQAQEEQKQQDRERQERQVCSAGCV